MELELEHTQQGSIYEVSISAEEKHLLLSNIEDSVMDPVMHKFNFPSHSRWQSAPASDHLKSKRTIESRFKRSSKIISLGHCSILLASSHTVKIKMEILLEPTSNKLLVAYTRNQDNRGIEYGRTNIQVESPTKNALITQDRIRGYDWSYQAEEETPTNCAFMALTSSESSSSSDSKDVRPIRNNSNRVNHKKIANKFTHLHPKRGFVPQAVLTRSTKINTIAASVNTAITPVKVTGSQSSVNHSRPISKLNPRIHSQQIRPFNKLSSNKRSVFNKKVNIVRVNDSTARERAVVSGNMGRESVVPTGGLTRLSAKAILDESNLWRRRLGHINFKTMNKLVKGNLVRAVLTRSTLAPLTAARPVTTVVPHHNATRPRPGKTVVTKPLSPPRRTINRSSSPKPSIFPHKVTIVKAPKVNVVKGVQGNWGNLQHALKDKGVIDIGCSRHMIRNMSYLTDFKEINGGYVAFGGNPKDLLLPIPFWAEEVNTACYVQNKVNLMGRLMRDFWLDTLINEVNAAGTPVPVVGQISTNSTNTFSAVGPSNTVVSPTLRESSYVDHSQYPDDPNMPALEDITYSDDEEDVGAEADFSNLEITIIVSPILTTRVHKDHPEEGIDYEEVFALVARIEAIRLFLAYASEKPLLKDSDGEDVDVHTYRVFNSPMLHVLRVEMVINSPWLLSKNWLVQKQTVFGKDSSNPFMADNLLKIVWFSTHHITCMKNWLVQKQMALGKDTSNPLIVDSLLKTIWFSIHHYLTIEVLAIPGKTATGKESSNPFMAERKSASTLIDTEKPLLKDPDGEDVDVHTYSGFLDSDYAGASLSRKSTTGGCQFLRCRLISWQCKKQIVVATSSTKAEYVAAASCAHVLWIQNQLLDYGRVENLEQDKIAQALEKIKLKKKVKKLEKKRKLKVSGLKRLRKVGTAQRIESSADTVMDDKEDASRDLEHADKVLSMQDDEPELTELQKVIEVVTIAKLMTEVVTAAITTITAVAPITAATITTAPSAARRRKGAVIRDQKETATLSTIIHTEPKSKDKGKGIMVQEPKPLKKQAHIEQDEAYARELEAELNKNINWDDVIEQVKRKEKEDNYFNSNVAFLEKSKEQLEEEESRALKRTSESLEEKAVKKQKLDEDVEELKKHLQIVPNDDDDDVYT
nr:uncharacterized mitochondrial protein AtMg00810-like [Tanacetum cinerariifolium]